MNGNVNVKFEN